MASSYSTQGRLELQATGENSGTWGSKTNTNLQLIEAMTDGYVSVAFASDANDALTTANASADESRNKVVKLTGVIGASRLMAIPAVEKVYIVNNATTGGFDITFGISGNTVVTVPNGEIRLVYCDGTDTYGLTYSAPGGTDVTVADGGTGRSTSTTAYALLAAGTTATGAHQTLASGATTELLVGGGASALPVWTTATGTGAPVRETSPTLVTPALGTPSALVGTNITGTAASLTAGAVTTNANLTGHITSTGNAAILGTFSLAQLNTAVSDDTLLPVSGGTWTGTMSAADQILSRPQIEDYAETVNAIGSIGGGTQDIDLTLGNVVSGTVDTSTTTFTFSNPSATGKACSFTLLLANGGSQTVNWPASVDWANATAPTLTTSGVDILTFFTVSAGTTWYGFVSGQAMG